MNSENDSFEGVKIGFLRGSDDRCRKETTIIFMKECLQSSKGVTIFCVKECQWFLLKSDDNSCQGVYYFHSRKF